MARVVIRIPRDPSKPRTVSVDGVMGASCKELTKGIESALGNQISDVETEEFNKTAEQNDQQVLEQGG